MTNYEKIKNMSKEELTAFLVDFEMTCYQTVGAILLDRKEYEKIISEFMEEKCDE